MPTVILGGGIIGSATAYYLSETRPAGDIHVVESSSQLFNSASGYAAGFLARDWFAPAVASLGELSFGLHESLSVEHGGVERWGYMKGTALSYDARIIRGNGTRGDGWMDRGASRAETASGSTLGTAMGAPAWLTVQPGVEVERISDVDTAQVDPLKLCRFLMDTAISRGVELHHPAKATSLVTDADGRITGVRIVDLVSQEASTIPCTHLVICAGAWTSRVFEELFPSAPVSISVSQLAGYSLVLRSPRHTLEHERQTYGGRCHAVFTSNPFSCGFSPEIFSRQGGEIYIAGLNDPDMPLPGRAEESRSLIDQNEMKRLEAVSAQLMGKLMREDAGVRDTDDLEVLREGLCFRPVSDRGTPVVCRVDDDLLGGGVRTDGHGGVFVASGHGPWGISLSLGTGRVVADMVEGVRPRADVGELGL
ncbi:FAD dependent oxidoreductase superfamily [Aspergillus bombycis]|uniref:FAD dependent oxidoreductase superfamily n=1 Tax=Aspergillus bombycis TaxID=109264 RepID=A0A1F8A9P2_9EURO|nr:FAD dependent oxidoreductase superfamily [Aspergillus bombycis]OGM48456.1 FAD dependent oxidoreductase superfamily [Aspergillus bombycis]